MKKFWFIALTILLFCAGCDSLGEDPLPAPGPHGTDGVVLFVNGTVYNFDYTAQYDGIQMPLYMDAKPDGMGGTIGGAQFLNMGSIEGGAFAGSEGSVYSQNGIKSMAFLNDLANNYEGQWRFTLFDNPPLLVSAYNGITYWAKYAAAPAVGSSTSVGVTIDVWTSSGRNIASVFNNIPVEARLDGQWHKYTVQLTKQWASTTPPVPLPDGETIKQWQITVPQNAGRIYVDEVILR
ncbi:MAG: hypothetical protein LBB72_06455 [Spirochaetaceae bacterium]|jgi:hypothetical protein|nr:hypothetical protein [Spirochaetaceae bacterium]